jgi:hypothetical protein
MEGSSVVSGIRQFCLFLDTENEVAGRVFFALYTINWSIFAILGLSRSDRWQW